MSTFAENSQAAAPHMNKLLDTVMAKTGDIEGKTNGHVAAIKAQLFRLFWALTPEQVITATARFDSYTKENTKLILALLTDESKGTSSTMRRIGGDPNQERDQQLTANDAMFLIETMPTAFEFADNHSIAVRSTGSLVRAGGKKFGSDTPREVMLGYAIDQSVRGSFGKDNPYAADHLAWLGKHAKALAPYAHILLAERSVERSLCESLLETPLPLADGVL